MKAALLALAVLAAVGAPFADAHHPCDDSGCNAHEPEFPVCPGSSGNLYKTVLLCVQEALP